MAEGYDYETIQGYEFLLPIVIERYISPETHSYQIPLEIGYTGSIFGSERQRLRALKIAIDFIRRRKELNDWIRSYKSDIAMSQNWGSSSVLLSSDQLKAIADGIHERQKPALEKVTALNQQLEELTEKARLDVKQVFMRADRPF